MQQQTFSCGIDVSSRMLEVCVVNAEDQLIRHTAKNTPEGIQGLIQWLRAHGVEQVVMEASGGYEWEARKRLTAAGIRARVVNPNRVRNFARGLGKQAKTDRIDAEVIGRFAAVAVPPLATVEHSQVEMTLQELHTRLCQLKQMRTQEYNRLRLAQGYVKKSVQRQLRSLNQEVDRIKRRIQSLIESDAALTEKVNLLTQHPGVGLITAAGLLATLPELGKVNRKQIAALAGLAPFTRESGQWKGKSYISGGRARARTTLYMAALVATQYNQPLRAFYQRLIGAGKAKKLALTAVMRKLLVICNATLQNA